MVVCSNQLVAHSRKEAGTREEEDFLPHVNRSKDPTDLLKEATREGAVRSLTNFNVASRSYSSTMFLFFLMSALSIREPMSEKLLGNSENI